MVSHGHVTVNGKACNIPSMLLKAGDTVTVKGRPRSLQLANLNLQTNPPPIPDYLERLPGPNPEGRVLRLPTRGDVDPRIQDIREQLIIEVCSR
jgi:small subunit ribosomal protein S4